MLPVFAAFLWVVLACAVAGICVWVLSLFTQDAGITRIGRGAIVVLLLVFLLWLLISFVGMPPLPAGPHRY